MTDVVNLRTARKRAARDKAAQKAAENRLAHSVSKAERKKTTADRKHGQQLLDQHKIERGDR